MDIHKLIDGFDAVIFDLGGVVIDLDYDATIEAFQKLGTENFKEIYSQALQTDLFDRYETGRISSMHFINKLKELLPASYSPNEIVFAWNAMIKDFQAEKLAVLEQLKQSYQTALLSNTNDLHEECVRRKLKRVSDKSLEHYFHHTFLSHKLKARKPDPDVFLFVCEQLSVSPQKTVFIDDSLQHIEGAQKAGLTAILFPQNETFV